jgi:hypothetical protein
MLRRVAIETWRFAVQHSSTDIASRINIILNVANRRVHELMWHPEDGPLNRDDFV